MTVVVLTDLTEILPKYTSFGKCHKMLPLMNSKSESVDQSILCHVLILVSLKEMPYEVA